jgi:acetyl esterase/lipase
MQISPWSLEDDAAVISLFGKVVAESIHRPGIKEEEIRYGHHLQQRILLYWPEKPEQRRRTAVVFIHGGGWNTGSPLLFRFVGIFFASLGYPAILCGYRLAPLFHFPTQIRDVRSGVEAGLKYFEKNEIEVQQIVAGGHSAGAQLSALLVFDQKPLRLELLRKEHYAGYYSISGPINFSVCTQSDIHGMIKGLIGRKGDWAKADPIHLIRDGEHPPVMLIHGDRDHLVDIENTLTFASALREHSTSPVEVQIFQGAHHADLVQIFLEDSPVARAFKDWLVLCDQNA